MDVIANICALPVHLKARGTASIDQLVEESGYRSARGTVTTGAVYAHLREHPHLIDAWLAYSEDKRASSGWFVTRSSSDRFEIGRDPSGERIPVADRVAACAEFIVREVDSIAG